jgi:hypothetical protein
MKMKIKKEELKNIITECLVEEGLFGKKKKKEAKKEFNIDEAFTKLKNKEIEVKDISRAGEEGKNIYTMAGIPKRDIPSNLTGKITLKKLDTNNNLVSGKFSSVNGKGVELIAYQGLLEQLLTDTIEEENGGDANPMDETDENIAYLIESMGDLSELYLELKKDGFANLKENGGYDGQTRLHKVTDSLWSVYHFLKGFKN